MRASLTIVSGIFLLLLSGPSAMAEYGPQDVELGENPPVSQPLVREGDFAIELAPLYGLGTPSTEAEAEDLLAQYGVLPLNGWISDYPVTPEVLGQLQKSAAQAATDGKLLMTAEESQRILFELASRMGLPVPAVGDAAEADGAEQPTIVYEQPVINNYYTGFGPPIITYYPPPAYYSYLYTWVQYPVWWYGYWFPGFYICNTFSTTIVVHSRTVYVRNRFVDHVTNRVVHVVPIAQAEHGKRPVTRIRTEDGRSFTNLREMREHWKREGRTNVRTANERTEHRQGYRTPAERRDAGMIYSRSVKNSRDTVRRDQSAGRTLTPGNEQRQRTPEKNYRTYTTEKKNVQRPAARRGGNSGRTSAMRSVQSKRAETITTRKSQKQYKVEGGRGSLTQRQSRRIEQKSSQIKAQKVETHKAVQVQRDRASSAVTSRSERKKEQVSRQVGTERRNDGSNAGRGSWKSSRDFRRR